MSTEQRDRLQKVSLMTHSTYQILQGQLKLLDFKYKTTLYSVGTAAGDNCDWHDNFAYDQACRDSQMYSKQVEQLRIKLSAVEFINPRLETENAGVGNAVIVQFSDEEEPEKLTLLGPDDSGKEQGWISFQSPIGKAIIGKKTGEVIHVNLGDRGKTQIIKILEILPGEFK